MAKLKQLLQEQEQERGSFVSMLAPTSSAIADEVHKVDEWSRRMKEQLNQASLNLPQSFGRREPWLEGPEDNANRDQHRWEVLRLTWDAWYVLRSSG